MSGTPECSSSNVRCTATRRSMLVAVALALVAAACSPAHKDTRPFVVSTIGAIHDVTARLAGDDFEVFCLLGTGTDPHTYLPNRSDIAQLARADLVFVNGLNLEAPMRATFEALERGGRPVSVVTDAVPREFLESGAEDHGLADPHLWMDPTAWLLVAGEIANELAALVPSARPRIEERLTELTREIETVDEYAARVLATVPESSRVLVTAHDAFGYWARRYGFEVAAIQGLSTESETGVRRIQELIDVIVEHDLPAIFVEESVSARGLEALRDGVTRTGRKVVIGGSLYSDSLGTPGTYRGTYVGMLDHNATVVATALGGTAPPGGCFDRLTGTP